MASQQPSSIELGIIIIVLTLFELIVELILKLGFRESRMGLYLGGVALALSPRSNLPAIAPLHLLVELVEIYHWRLVRRLVPVRLLLTVPEPFFYFFDGIWPLSV